MIKALAVVYIFFLLALSAYFFVIRSLVVAIISLVITLLYAWFLWSCRDRIPFAKLMLKTVTRVISSYPAMIFTGFVGLILQTAFAALFIITTIGIVLRYSTTVTDPSTGRTTTSISGVSYVLYVFLLFTLYWTTQVIKNVVHVTVSGVFATYYFMGVADSSGRVIVSTQNPTVGAAKRALTTSFGSVCYG